MQMRDEISKTYMSASMNILLSMKKTNVSLCDILVSVNWVIFKNQLLMHQIAEINTVLLHKDVHHVMC